uniref:Uncharacterized protein n=1 Tax=Tanacetum cinerariifolium TaxID=118510 RepID=A0A6L2JEW0_TANCI|nr:hypothetical protein [Tanacetum cinerariifolium]
MDRESAKNNVVAKLPLLRQGDYEIWKLRIEQYFQVQDYALWDVIENGNSFKPVPRTTANADVGNVVGNSWSGGEVVRSGEEDAAGLAGNLVVNNVSAQTWGEDRLQFRARGTGFLWELVGKVVGNSWSGRGVVKKMLQTLFEAIQARFSGNDATKKTQRTLLKQMYENFNAPSTESLDYIFNRLQKIVSQLAILGENISQEDLNMKFLRSLPSEWNTHVVVWKNKADLDTMSIDDLYNNFKIVEQEVKRTVVSSSSSSSSSSSGSPNMAFLSSSGSTNEVDTTSIQVSTVRTPVSTVSSHDNTANLSDATMYAFLANQPNGSQLVHEDLEQIYEDDLEEMDLKWQLALLSMIARRCDILQGNAEVLGIKKQPRNQDNSRKTVNVEDTYSKAMVAIDGAGFDWSYMADDEVPTNMALMAFSDSEFNKSEFDLATYKRGLAFVEEQLVFYKKNEVVFCDHQMYLAFSTMLKNFDREDLEVLWKIVKDRFKES